MRFGMKQMITTTAVLVLAYLVLTRYRGAAAVINATGTAYSGAVKTLQGR